jgi:hypothetical protein
MALTTIDFPSMDINLLLILNGLSSGNSVGRSPLPPYVVYLTVNFTVQTMV